MALLKRNSDKPTSIIEGRLYDENDGDRRVLAWHSDGRHVRFSDEGSSREHRTDLHDFLERFTLVEEEQPKATVNNEDGTAKE